MQLRIILVLFVFCFSFSIANLKGQDLALVDSLSNRLPKVEQDTERINILNDLAFEWSIHAPLKAVDAAQKALSLSQKIDFKKGEASAYMRFGTIYMHEGDYEKADSFYLIALDKRKLIGSVIDIAGTYNNLGLIQYYNGDDEKAVNYYKQGLTLLEGHPPTQKEAMLCNNIGESYMYLGEYEEAIRYINQGISIREKINDEIGKANSLVNLGIWYNEIDNHPKAIETFEHSLAIFTKKDKKNKIAKCHINLGNVYYEMTEDEKATANFRKALELKEYLEGADIAIIYQTQGEILRSNNQLNDALDAFNNSLKTFSINGNAGDIAAMILRIGTVYYELNQYEEALDHYQRSKSIADTLNNLSLSWEISHELSNVYAKLDQTDLALEYSKRSIELKDSIYENLQEAANYKMNYEEEKSKNALLEKEQVAQVAISQRKSTMITGLIVGGILWTLLTIAIVLAYRFQKKQKDAELEIVSINGEIDTLLQTQQIKTTYAKLAGQDEERKRIGQDLHDRVGGILATVKLYFKDLDEKLDTIQVENKRQFNKATNLLDEAVDEVRKIARNIHSGVLTKIGLKVELENLGKLLNESNRIKVIVNTHGLENRLPTDTAINVYRIIQELVSNVLKHADANKIDIQVSRFQNVLNVIVEDNGKGFDPAQVKKKDNGMGLKNIESRVHELHGSIIIDSLKGRGTSVSFDVPLEESFTDVETQVINHS